MESNYTTQSIAKQVADRILQLNATKDAVSAVMYLRSLVGTEFDETFHAIMRKAGDNQKKKQKRGVQ